MTQLSDVVLAVRLVSDSISVFLSLPDFLPMHVALARFGDVFSTEVWASLASAVCHGLAFNLKLFEPCCRPQLLSLMPAFLSVCVAQGSRIVIGTIEEARSISKHVDNARRSAASHVANGGHAQVLLSHLRFPSEGLADELNKSSWSINHARAAREHLAMHMSEEKLLAGADSIVVGVPPGLVGAPGDEENEPKWSASACRVKIQMAMVAGGLLASADAEPIVVVEQSYNEREFEMTMPRMTVDLATVCPDVTIHLRGFVLELNGAARHSSTCIFFLPKGTAVAAEALSQGVVCVFCLRSGSVVPKPIWAQTLNIDRQLR
eukprot:TRINITY_DN12456_c0_g1_i1.p1 TRINITY_DN12456_c0_g1~~TRINITY_DN12456_c0_g1_i1.p1  ORF type:complete len:320 (+),score=48.20 TRINITY_DN12456_c0_g1_i1:59-1018(+)